MAGRLTPPIFPLRPADANSRFLAKDLVIAYPLLNPTSVVKNYGSWGSALDLSITNAVYSRTDGIATLNFGAGAVASKTGLNMTIPSRWSYAYWVKVDEAPTSEVLNVFRFQGLTEGHVRAWMDVQGIWSWQKYSTADAYSILPASTIPTERMMLVVGVYGDNFTPPAQLYTGLGITTPPEQPFSYAVYNTGQGTQATNFRSFYLGNDPNTVEPLKGSIGPLYIWGRAVSLSEIWQLWKDPYAPFRRNMEQDIVPSTMVSFSDFSLEGTGKSTSPKPLFQDDNAITIPVMDYITYVAAPSDTFDPGSGNLPHVTINVADSYLYAEFPTDELQTLLYPRIDITVADTINYVAFPTDTMQSVIFPRIDVTVEDSIAYVDNPTDVFVGPESPLITSDVITINDDYEYVNLPDDTVTSS